MAADGTWDVTMDTPMGERKAKLVLKSASGKLEGTQSAEEGSADIFDGTVNGNNVAWKLSIVQPMALTLEFTGAIEGNAMTGSVKLGMFGTSSFRGTRT